MADTQEQAIPATEGTGAAAPIKPSMTYQPKDAEGNNIGRPQVVEGETWEEVANKIRDMHMHASQHIHSLRKQIKPETVTDTGVEFKPRDLTEAERWTLTTELSNPATVDTALERAMEAKLGAPVAKVRELLNRTQETDKIQRAEQESQAWLNTHLDYKICPHNQAAMIKYLQDNKLACTQQNLSYAFETLQQDGLVLLNEPEAPVTPQPQGAEVPPADERQHEAIPPAAPTSGTRPRGAPSATGLFAHNSSAVQGESTAKKSADAAFAREALSLPPEEYKRRIMSDAKFKQRVNEVFAQK